MSARDSIAAIATPPGRGGVGIIRISGDLAYQTALAITGKSVLKHGCFSFSTFKNAQSEVIDHGLVLYFKAPASFTGEDVVEFQIHGSPVLLDWLLKECLSFGIRLANPGEFSERAFLNDKMDLSQAEAIADLINASSLTAARMSVKTLQGDFSSQIQTLSEKIVHLRLFVEAALDFPEEEINFLEEGHVAAKLAGIVDELLLLKNKTAQGVLMREGMNIVIAGKPNAGKSTLINRLAQKDVAIVTDIPGTTRDVMQVHISMDGLPLHIVDTAGIRESHDVVEQEGIRRALLAVSQADCILLMADVEKTQSIESHDLLSSHLPDHIPVINVLNKIDIHPALATESSRCIHLSAKTGEGMEALKQAIKDVAGFSPVEGQFLARRRHLEALDKTEAYLLHGQTQLEVSRAAELLAEDLRLAHQSLCTITGEFTSDDLLGKIFSSFCIGK